MEYYDSFGTYNHFKMPAYYRMCDQLVEAMRHNEPLMEKHKNRCTLSTQPLHPDANLHLLAFDVIYCSYHYYLTAGTSYARITGAERKRYLEKQAKAKELASQLDQAQQDIQLYQEAAQYYGSLFTSGMPVCHRLFGEGTVVFLKDSALGRRTVEVVFPKANRTMQFDTVTLILSGLMQLPSVKQDELKEKAALYRAVIQKGEASLISELKSAEKAFLPYREYLA